MTVKNHQEFLRKIAPECMVLLKSDGSFPLSGPQSIALYGNGARYTKKGGTGSGDVNVKQFLNIETALKKAGFEITTTEWLDSYDAAYEKAWRKFRNSLRRQIAEQGLSAFLSCMGAAMPEMEYDFPMEAGGDVCLYVLSRNSGEGTDREVKKGDFLLTDTEIRDIRKAGEKYERFLLVLNVGGVIDLSPVVDAAPNILLLSQTGMMTSEVLCDVILGKSYPSGKLASTWAAWEDYCHEGDFGKQDDTRYREGIYVGYRYFDTVCKNPLFPFGFGLGYTSFQTELLGLEKEAARIRVKVSVTNCGERNGKEVVQAYVSVPEGKLDQPYQVLAAFEKTDELKPGESQVISLEFNLKDLASYCREISARILEKGSYRIYIGNSSRETVPAGTVILNEDIITEKVTSIADQPDFMDYRPEKKCQSGQAQEEGCWETLYITREDFASCEDMRQICPKKTDDEILAVMETMDNCELAYLCVGNFQDEGNKSVIGNAGTVVVGAAGETTRIFQERGISSIVMADGPAGIRIAPKYGRDEEGVYSVDGGNLEELADILPDEMRRLFLQKDRTEKWKGEIFEQYCSAIPVGTAIAQSFSRKAAEQCGELVAEEMEQYGISLWLAPALNIHRNPLCGRNFEYYSEDPLVSGCMAAAVTRGVQSRSGCGVTLKHFACNNQEQNRMHSNSIVSERALRDLYLRGFEIAVKDSSPAAVMTSYNLLNGEHTSSRKDLLTGILRDEWGFDGLVMSDWVVTGVVSGKKYKYPSASASAAVRAGNDLFMPGGKADYEDIIRATEQPDALYPVTRKDLMTSAYRVLKTVKRLVQKKCE